MKSSVSESGLRIRTAEIIPSDHFRDVSVEVSVKRESTEK